MTDTSTATVKDYSDDKTIMGYMYKALKESLEKKAKPRMANFELLRVISMIMVIVLHYLSKGGILDLQANSMGEGNALFWLLEAFCLVAVNAYVLISGYFMVQAEYSIPKIIGIWCQVFFYSVIVGAVSLAVGIYSLSDFLCLRNILFFVFPVSGGHYWFASAYIIMYLFSPIIVNGIKAINKDKLKLIILIILIPLCFLPSVWPFELPIDDKGNSFVWFVALFIIAGYIRLYGIKVLENRIVAWCVYVLSALMIILTRVGLCTFSSQHTGYEYLPTIVCHYNFVFVLTASLGFFYIFKNAKLKENIFSFYILKISPFVFGVYLLHEHLTIRYEWVKWLKVNNQYGFLRPIHIFLTCIIIFAAGILVDVIRYYLFILCKKIMIWGLNIYFAKREMWDYLIFGFFATVVNWVAYIACSYCLLIPILGNNDNMLKVVSNVIAWVVAVVFAYWTNRNFVFKSTVTGFGNVMKEFSSFIGSRIFSFVVEQVLFAIAIFVNMSDIIAKLIISVVVIILNYIFSKLFVFKKAKQ